MKKEGNSINYEYRMHDPRIGRFFCIDPLSDEYPHNSPYAFSENMVIHMVELEGLEAADPQTGATTSQNSFVFQAGTYKRFTGKGFFKDWGLFADIGGRFQNQELGSDGNYPSGTNAGLIGANYNLSRENHSLGGFFGVQGSTGNLSAPTSVNYTGSFSRNSIHTNEFANSMGFAIMTEFDIANDMEMTVTGQVSGKLNGFRGYGNFNFNGLNFGNLTSAEVGATWHPNRNMGDRSFGLSYNHNFEENNSIFTFGGSLGALEALNNSINENKLNNFGTTGGLFYNLGFEFSFEGGDGESTSEINLRGGGL